MLLTANTLVYYTNQGLLFDGDSQGVGHILEVVRLTAVILLALLPQAPGMASDLASQYPACMALVLIHAISLIAILAPGGKEAISGTVSTSSDGEWTKDIKAQ